MEQISIMFIMEQISVMFIIEHKYNVHIYITEQISTMFIMEQICYDVHNGTDINSIILDETRAGTTGQAGQALA